MEGRGRSRTRSDSDTEPQPGSRERIRRELQRRGAPTPPAGTSLSEHVRYHEHYVSAACPPTPGPAPLPARLDAARVLPLLSLFSGWQLHALLERFCDQYPALVRCCGPASGRDQRRLRAELAHALAERVGRVSDAELAAATGAVPPLACARLFWQKHLLLRWLGIDGDAAPARHLLRDERRPACAADPVRSRSRELTFLVSRRSRHELPPGGDERMAEVDGVGATHASVLVSLSLSDPPSTRPAAGLPSTWPAAGLPSTWPAADLPSTRPAAGLSSTRPAADLPEVAADVTLLCGQVNISACARAGGATARSVARLACPCPPPPPVGLDCVRAAPAPTVTAAGPSPGASCDADGAAAAETRPRQTPSPPKLARVEPAVSRIRWSPPAQDVQVPPLPEVAEPTAFPILPAGQSLLASDQRRTYAGQSHADQTQRHSERMLLPALTDHSTSPDPPAVRGPSRADRRLPPAVADRATSPDMPVEPTLPLASPDAAAVESRPRRDCDCAVCARGRRPATQRDVGQQADLQAGVASRWYTAGAGSPASTSGTAPPPKSSTAVTLPTVATAAAEEDVKSSHSDDNECRKVSKRRKPRTGGKARKTAGGKKQGKARVGVAAPTPGKSRWRRGKAVNVEADLGCDPTTEGTGAVQMARTSSAAAHNVPPAAGSKATQHAAPSTAGDEVTSADTASAVRYSWAACSRVLTSGASAAGASDPPAAADLHGQLRDVLTLGSPVAPAQRGLSPDEEVVLGAGQPSARNTDSQETLPCETAAADEASGERRTSATDEPEPGGAELCLVEEGGSLRLTSDCERWRSACDGHRRPAEVATRERVREPSADRSLERSESSRREFVRFRDATPHDDSLTAFSRRLAAGGVDANRAVPDPSTEPIQMASQGGEMVNQGVETTGQATQMMNEAVSTTGLTSERINQGMETTDETVEMMNEAVGTASNDVDWIDQGAETTDETVEMMNEAVGTTSNAVDWIDHGAETTDETAEMIDEAVGTASQAVYGIGQGVWRTDHAMEIVIEAVVTTSHAMQRINQGMHGANRPVETTSQGVETANNAAEITIHAVKVIDEAVVTDSHNANATNQGEGARQAAEVTTQTVEMVGQDVKTMCHAEEISGRGVGATDQVVGTAGRVVGTTRQVVGTTRQAAMADEAVDPASEALPTTSRAAVRTNDIAKEALRALGRACQPPREATRAQGLCVLCGQRISQVAVPAGAAVDPLPSASAPLPGRPSADGVGRPARPLQLLLETWVSPAGVTPVGPAAALPVDHSLRGSAASTDDADDSLSTYASAEDAASVCSSSSCVACRVKLGDKVVDI